MSLREQLLKAGLVSGNKVKETESIVRKQKHQIKKNKSLATAEAVKKAAEQQRLAAEEQRKKERDRELNRESEAKKKRTAELARLRQLIDGQRLNDSEAELRYNFSPDGRRVCFVRVTPQQQKHLAMGKIGIVRNHEDEWDFVMVPRQTALTIADIDPASMLLLYPESSSLEVEEST